MSSPSSEANETIERIKSEIETLKRQHLEALKAATYLGITREGARLQEERRSKITQLMKEFAGLIDQLSQLQQ